MDGHRPAIITHVPATITGFFRGRARRYLHRRRGELVGCRVFAYWMAVCPSLSEFRPRIGVRGMLSIVGMKITRMARFPKKCAIAGRLVARPWLGTSPSATFLSCDPGLPVFARTWLVSPAGAGIHPGSESGTCFRTNDARKTGPLKSEQSPCIVNLAPTLSSGASRVCEHHGALDESAPC